MLSIILSIYKSFCCVGPLARIAVITTAPDAQYCAILCTSVSVTCPIIDDVIVLPTESTALAREQDSRLQIMKFARGSIEHCLDIV